MFSVSALFVCDHKPMLFQKKDRLWEEKIVCICCEEDKVKTIADEYFRNEEMEYETQKGMASWHFVQIIDIYKPVEDTLGILFHNQGLKVIEVFSRHLTEQQAKSLLKNVSSEYKRDV
ncbi:MAG: hypothetical protein GXX92_02030 [Clostridiales bacterium]|nr:hypothetical protein [Clostridiales bacterium]